jgi:hypothetical protein
MKSQGKVHSNVEALQAVECFLHELQMSLLAVMPAAQGSTAR